MVNLVHTLTLVLFLYSETPVIFDLLCLLVCEMDDRLEEMVNEAMQGAETMSMDVEELEFMTWNDLVHDYHRFARYLIAANAMGMMKVRGLLHGDGLSKLYG